MVGYWQITDGYIESTVELLVDHWRIYRAHWGLLVSHWRVTRGYIELTGGPLAL